MFPQSLSLIGCTARFHDNGIIVMLGRFFAERRCISHHSDGVVAKGLFELRLYPCICCHQQNRKYG